MSGRLPSSASVAHGGEGAKMFAPAAERNAVALTDMVRTYCPIEGKALEIASGTGQHIVALAKAMPELHWQPTEIDAARRASIDAYVTESDLPNVRPSVHLDATERGWSGKHGGQDLILLINLFHLLSDTDVRRIILEAAAALTPGGIFVVYGPFRRSGQLTSPGDMRFDAELRAADPAIGYKDDRDMLSWFDDFGLDQVETIAMPANNLAFVARKPA